MRQKETALQRDGVGHGENALIATSGCNPGEGDTHIAASRLGNDATGPQKPQRLGLTDHLQGDTVFDAPPRIQHFELGQDGCARLLSYLL